LRPFNFIDDEVFQCLAQELINIGATYGKINFKDIKPSKNTITNYVPKICNEIEGSIIKRTLKILQERELHVTFGYMIFIRQTI
jgi:hypothetical protein